MKLGDQEGLEVMEFTVDEKNHMENVIAAIITTENNRPEALTGPM